MAEDITPWPIAQDPQLKRGHQVRCRKSGAKFAVQEVIPESGNGTRLKAYRLSEVSPWPVKQTDVIAGVYLRRFYTVVRGQSDVKRSAH